MHVHTFGFLIIIHSSCLCICLPIYLSIHLSVYLSLYRRNTRHVGDYGNPLTECVRQGGKIQKVLKVVLFYTQFSVAEFLVHFLNIDHVGKNSLCIKGERHE